MAAASHVTAAEHGTPRRGRHCTARFASRGATASLAFICASGTPRKRSCCAYISPHVHPVTLHLGTATAVRWKHGQEKLQMLSA